MSIPTPEAAQATLDAARAKLAALKEERRQVEREKAEAEATIKRLNARIYELTGGYQPWRGQIEPAEKAVTDAAAMLSDLSAPRVRFTGIAWMDGEYVIVSAGPKQVKVRPFGSPRGTITTVERSTASAGYNCRVDGGTEALESAVAGFKARSRT